MQTTEAENFDRSSLELAGNSSQHSLLAAIVATGKPVVVVLINGGPIAWDHTGVAAVLEAFYPGELGGEAIVDAPVHQLFHELYRPGHPQHGSGR